MKAFSVLNELRAFALLPGERKCLLAETLLALALARVAMVSMPFRMIAAWLGSRGNQSPPTATTNEIHTAKEIGWAIGVLARRVPWDGRCLAQALAASWMLRRRGLEGTVSFGAGRNETAEFRAHAWLRVGPCVVTGGPGHERFKVLTTFARRQK